MLKYFKGYLPQGVVIVEQTNPEHRYLIPGSTTMCFPFSLDDTYQQVTIDAANTQPFVNVYVPGIRAWASREPSGISMTSTLYAQAHINPPPSGVAWNFWRLDLQGSIELDPAAVHSWIDGTSTYWFNLQNLENKQGSYYCRFTYSGPGISLIA